MFLINFKSSANASLCHPRGLCGWAQPHRMRGWANIHVIADTDQLLRGLSPSSAAWPLWASASAAGFAAASAIAVGTQPHVWRPRV